MIRKHVSLLVLILILSAFAANFKPPVPAQALPTGWRTLTGVLPAHADIAFGWKISPDSHYVVFIADSEVDGRNELYSALLTGTMPIKLNPPLVVGGRVQRFAITADNQYVLYIADQEVDNREELYRVPITGGQAVKLNGPLVSGGNVTEVRVDPDNVRVVYKADQQVNDVLEIYSVPLAGGTPVKLNATLVAGGDVSAFEIDPISNRVVYTADQEVDGRYEIYGVPIASGTVVKLNPPGSRDTYNFKINPTLQVVVFSARPSGLNNEYLYMNATAGGLLTTLNPPLASTQNVFGYQVSPDGARVVYNITTMTSTLSVQQGNLYSVLIGGGAPTLLTTAADSGFGVYGANFYITSDSQRVIYRYQKNATSSPVLESVSMSGSNRATLYSQGSDEPIYHLNVSPNGQWVVYNTYPSFQMHSVPTTGGTAVGLGNGFDPKTTPDSSRVMYTTNQLSDDYDLCTQQIFSGGTRNLSRVGDEAQVVRSAISPDGQSIVFEVEYLSAGTELRVSDGGEAPFVFYTYLPVVQK
ncbi:hypothetical protein TFLX_06062 [Thermoflexales bacterium]|nr:hypothetical protein TFLX_06062 [Thermoflexales bacterium]